MMRNYFTILILLIANVCFGQFFGEEDIKLNPFSDNSLPLFGVLRFGDEGNKKILYLNADPGTQKMSDVMVHPLKEKTSLVYLEGATKIRFYSYIPKDSLKDYRYSVVGDDTLKIVQDLVPTQFKGNGGIVGKDQADFGAYNTTNKKLSVTLYKVGDEENARALIIYNRNIKAVELISAELVNPGATENVNLNLNGGLIEADINGSYANITISKIDNSFLYCILIKRQEEGGKLEITTIEGINWINDTHGNLITREDIKYFQKPGKYEVIIYPKIGAVDVDKIENGTSIKFEIAKPRLTVKRVGIYACIIVLSLVSIFGLILYIIKRKNKRKLLAEQQRTEISKSKLEVVRAQLNPHFMFNALAGIQSLMNQQKTEEANAYLGKFSRLTRNVLDNQELISIAEEQTLLDDYLQMEQLRFGFKYAVNIQPDVDLNTEIPAMLLQPFVENAVKHGIAEKGKDGSISISFAKADNDLLLEIKDNGLGFDASKNYEGLGLALSKNRIALLNNIYKENELVLEMKASEKGTIITVVLKQWL